MTMAMRTSKRGTDFIARWERFEPCRYRDQGGLWTIGYGHLIKKGETFKEPMTHEEGLDLLAKDMAAAEKAVNTVRVALTQNQFDALVSLVFNIGGGNFSASTLLRKLNDADYEGAANQFKAWRYVKGKESQGLLNRRTQEAELFRTD